MGLSVPVRVKTGHLMTRGVLGIEWVRLWVDTGGLRSILRTVLIGGGAVVLFRNDAGLALAALSSVPIDGVRASIARLRLRDTWIALKDQMSLLPTVMEENSDGIRVFRAVTAQTHAMPRFDCTSDPALPTPTPRRPPVGS